MIIEVKDIPKLSFNVYNHLHWSEKKRFKDTLRLLMLVSTKNKFIGAYDLNFTFEFKGKKLDTINVVHYCKVIEDFLFKQDKENRQICINVKKGKTNNCKIELIKLL